MSELNMDPHVGMTAKIETGDEVLEDLLNKGKICFAPLFIIYDSIDERAEESYFKSPYSGIFHERRYILDRVQLVGFVWTTKSKTLNISK